MLCFSLDIQEVKAVYVVQYHLANIEDGPNEIHFWKSPLLDGIAREGGLNRAFKNFIIWKNAFDKTIYLKLKTKIAEANIVSL